MTAAAAAAAAPGGMNIAGEPNMLNGAKVGIGVNMPAAAAACCWAAAAAWTRICCWKATVLAACGGGGDAAWEKVGTLAEFYKEQKEQ